MHYKLSIPPSQKKYNTTTADNTSDNDAVIDDEENTDDNSNITDDNDKTSTQQATPMPMTTTLLRITLPIVFSTTSVGFRPSFIFIQSNNLSL